MSEELIASIRCVCGKVVANITRGNPAQCKCGTVLELRAGRGKNVQAWAIAPDGYDLTKRKINRPEVVSMKWSER